MLSWFQSRKDYIHIFTHRNNNSQTKKSKNKHQRKQTKRTGVENKTASLTSCRVPMLHFLINSPKSGLVQKWDIRAGRREAACWVAVSHLQAFQLSLRPLHSQVWQKMDRLYSPGMHVLCRALTLILREEQPFSRAENHRGLTDNPLAPISNHRFIPSFKEKKKKESCCNYCSALN